MSGQTYHITLAAPRTSAAAIGREAGVTDGARWTDFCGEQVLRALAPIARPAPRAVRRSGDRVDVVLRVDRIEVDLTVRAPQGRTPVVQWRCRPSAGLTCTDEARLSTLMATRLAAAGLQPTAPQAAAATAAPHESRRRSG